MKSIATGLSAGLIMLFAACFSDDNPPKDSGGDQVKEPVMNSGANTEAERAVEATRDSATKRDSAVHDNNDTTHQGTGGEHSH